MEWICTINYSEKDYLEFIKREIEDEYCDIVQHVIEEIKKNRNIKVEFSGEGKGINTCSNRVNVSAACRDGLYMFVFGFQENIRETIRSLRECRSLNIDDHILKSICLFCVLYITFHEFAHIIQGHNSIYREKDSHIEEKKAEKESWLEFDADISAALLLRFLLDWKPDLNLSEKNNEAACCIFAVSICISCCYFVYGRNESAEYLSFDVRIWASVLAFLENAKMDSSVFFSASEKKQNVCVSISKESIYRAVEIIDNVFKMFAELGFAEIKTDVKKVEQWIENSQAGRMNFLNEVHGFTD